LFRPSSFEPRGKGAGYILNELPWLSDTKKAELFDVRYRPWAR
jgi:hypothetical protein